MDINPQIKTVLRQFNIPEDDAIAYLLSVYFNCKPSYTPILLVQRLNVTNILGIGESREVIWHIPLFDNLETQDKWEWVKEWNAMFKTINPKRCGSNKDCITRMKAFFADNPDVRKEDVVAATKMYFGTVTDSGFLISSHYFISKGVGRDRASALGLWVDKYQEYLRSTSVAQTSNNMDKSSIMQ